MGSRWQTGGIAGGRPFNEADPFEAAVACVLDLSDDSLACELWSALANVTWLHDSGNVARYSFRAAGDLIAAVRGEGDYMDWYCCGPARVVSDRIHNALAVTGWLPVFEAGPERRA